MNQPANTPANSTEDTSYYGVLRWLVLATFIVILNETIMVNAIPRLMEQFDVPETDAQWLSTAFMLTMAVVIPVTGWFLQRVTTRAAFMTAMVVFCAGTALAAVAWSFPVLVAARIIQAGGTAVMMPLLMTTLMTVVPVEHRGRVMGNVTLAISVAPALGPTVSGVILEYASWRWIFLIVLPIAALITYFALRKLDNVGEPVAGPIDWISVPLAVIGFGSLVYGLSQMGADAGQVVIEPWIAAVVGAVGVLLFVLRQLQLQRGGAPLLDLRTLKHRLYTTCLALMAAAFMAMFGVMILLPLYLQNLRGVSTLETGLLLMPGGIAMGLLGPTVGRLFDAYGGRVLVIPGSVVLVVAMFGFSRIGETTPLAMIPALHIALCVGLAFVFTPVFTIGLGALPMELYSHGSSLLGTLQQLGGAAGTALLVAVMTSRASDLSAEGATENAASIGGMESAFTVAGVISIAVLVLAFFVPGKSGGDSADAVPVEATDELAAQPAA